MELILSKKEKPKLICSSLKMTNEYLILNKKKDRYLKMGY